MNKDTAGGHGPLFVRRGRGKTHQTELDDSVLPFIFRRKTPPRFGGAAKLSSIALRTFDSRTADCIPVCRVSVYWPCAKPCRRITGAFVCNRRDGKPVPYGFRGRAINVGDGFPVPCPLTLAAFPFIRNWVRIASAADICPPHSGASGNSGRSNPSRSNASIS